MYPSSQYYTQPIGTSPYGSGLFYDRTIPVTNPTINGRASVSASGAPVVNGAQRFDRERLTYAGERALARDMDMGNYQQALTDAQIAVAAGSTTNRYGYTDNRYLTGADYRDIYTKVGQASAAIDYQNNLARGNTLGAVADANSFFDAGNNRLISISGYPSMIATQQLATSNPGMYNFLLGQQPTTALSGTSLGDDVRNLYQANAASQYVYNVQSGNTIGALTAAERGVHPLAVTTPTARSSYLPKDIMSNASKAAAANVRAQEAAMAKNVLSGPYGSQPVHFSNPALLNTAVLNANQGQLLNQNLQPVAAAGIPNVNVSAVGLPTVAPPPYIPTSVSSLYTAGMTPRASQAFSPYASTGYASQAFSPYASTGFGAQALSPYASAYAQPQSFSSALAGYTAQQYASSFQQPYNLGASAIATPRAAPSPVNFSSAAGLSSSAIYGTPGVYY